LDPYFEEEKNKGGLLFESLRLYGLCEQFKCLPASGGIYDQDPMLLEEWLIISGEVAKVKNKELEATKDGVNETSAPYSSNTPAFRKSIPSGKVGGLNFKRVPAIPPVFQRYHKSGK
jgi:hypothetical protein